MKGDFSRNTFDPARHYSAVLLQQGRVQVDADWNEQQQIQSHRVEAEASDVIGLSGAPEINPGFSLSFTPNGADFVIGAGRYYVDGMLCELTSDTPFSFTSDGDAVVSLPVLRPELVDLRPGQWLVVAPNGVAAQLLQIVSVASTPTTVNVTLSAAIGAPPAPAVAPVTGLLQRVATYLSQSDYPGGDAGLVTAATGNSAARLNLADGTYVVYLDVWRRHLTALDDPRIRERALGGPDTTSRLKTVSQVKLLKVTPPATATPTTVCSASFPEWDALLQPSGGSLAARPAPSTGPSGPCLIPPRAGYQGLENQLYRVEIHDPGALGRATFKWSRDNGSVVTSILAFNGTTLSVLSTGPDDALGFANGQWVEVIGDADELQGRPGQLLQIGTVDPAGTITLKGAPTPIDGALSPKLRRWDSVGLLSVPTLPDASGGWLDLENGVQVQFSGSDFRTGDYWQIPARSGATADIEWPHAVPQAALGVGHHRARLGLISAPIADPSQPIHDCRPTFAPLTHVPRALHIQSINWLNDDVYTFNQLRTTGLQVTLDGPPVSSLSLTVDPSKPPITLPPMVTVNTSSMIVTLEVPATIAGTAVASVNPRVLAVLNGDITVSGNVAVWKPVVNGQEIQELLFNVTGLPPRVRVTLKGNSIWSDQGAERLFLDGVARGQPGLRASDPQNPGLRSDLLLPSGAGNRASDFESWFFLQFVPPQPALSALTLTPAQVLGGAATTGRVLLSSITPAGGATVSLTSSNPAVATVSAASVVVPPNQSSVTFAISTLGTAPVGVTAVTITASFNGSSVSATLNVVAVAVTVTPASLSLLAGQTFQFAAAVAGAAAGALSTGVTWSTSGGGAIDANGVYTASSPGTFTITARSLADSTKIGTATVTVSTKGKDKDKENVKDGKELPDKVFITVVEGKARIKDLEVLNPLPVINRPFGGVVDPPVLHLNQPPLTIGSNPILISRFAAPAATAAGEATPAEVAPGTEPGQAFIEPEERPEVGIEIKPRNG